MIRLALLAGYVAAIVLANIITSSYGLVPAGFGLLVPAGTYLAGLALSLRDQLQRTAGLRWVWAGIVGGIAVSVLAADGRIALASGAAFLLSELLDLGVYSALRAKTWRGAVITSNAVGAVVDTLVFLALAGFPVTSVSVGGQLLVKAVWCTATFLLVSEVIRRAVPRERLVRAGA